jgi:2-polyprenyl-3-methyl-5-hydroxy-6-metoxy-1,4-benzoquinol methylase
VPGFAESCCLLSPATGGAWRGCPITDGHDVRVTDELLAEQARYYRQRAAEYDATAYPDSEAARARIGRLVAAMRPAGEVLEIACGTGMWTGALAAPASSVTAMDAAPEMVQIARARVSAARVKFVVADVFSWAPPGRFDTVFFAFWLSHVPSARLDGFLTTATDAVAPEGRLLFVDEHADPRHEEWTDNPEIAIREMTDGSRHEIVKVFVEPEQLAARLDRLGWLVDFDVDHAWLIGSTRRR